MNNQYNDLHSQIIINTESKMYGKVRLVAVDKQEFHSNIYIPYKYNLKSIIKLRLKNDLNSIVRIRHKKDLNSTIKIRKIEYADLSSNVNIISRSIMYGKVRLIALDKNEFDSNIYVPYSNNLESNIELRLRNDLESIIRIRHKKDLDSTILVRRKEEGNLKGSIAVNPKTRMLGKATIVEPPRRKQLLYPVKDAFVRSKVPVLNYGNVGDLIVGLDNNNEEFLSYLFFNVRELPKEKIKIINAKLKLTNLNEESFKDLGIYELTTFWNELSVTYASKPRLGNLINSIDIEGKNKVTEIDITNIFNSWYDKPYLNYGITLKSLNNTINQLKTFYAREHGENGCPAIEVEYYDISNIYSIDKTELTSNINVIGNGKKDLTSNINVKQWYNDSDFESSINIKNSSILDGTITVSRNQLNSKIILRQFNNLPSQLTINRIILPNDFNSQIFINQNMFKCRIDVKSSCDLESNIRVRKTNVTHDFKSNIYINQNFLKCTIYIKGINDLESSITINKTYLESNIYVPYSNNLKGTIRLRKYNELPSTIRIVKIKYKNLKSNITVRKNDTNNLTSTINTRQVSNLKGNITIRRNEFVDLENTIIVRRTGETKLNGNIQITPYHDFKCQLRISSSIFKSNITVRRTEKADHEGYIIIDRVCREIESSIYVRQVNDLKSTIKVIAVWFNDLESQIIVGKKKKKRRAYAYIM